MTPSRHLAAFTLGCALLVPCGAALAGHDHGPGPEPGARIEQELQLTPEQSQQFRAIMQEQAEKRRALWQDTRNRAAIPDRMKALHEETRARLAAVLNEVQLEKMDEHMQRRGERGFRHRDGKPGDGEYVARQLGLDDAQQEQVRKIFADTHAQRESIMGSAASREERHAKMTALHAGVREKMAKILSADQLRRFDDMHARHLTRMERHRDRGPRRDDGTTRGSRVDAPDDGDKNGAETETEARDETSAAP